MFLCIKDPHWKTTIVSGISNLGSKVIRDGSNLISYSYSLAGDPEVPKLSNGIPQKGVSLNSAQPMGWSKTNLYNWAGTLFGEQSFNVSCAVLCMQSFHLDYMKFKIALVDTAPLIFIDQRCTTWTRLIK